MIRAIGLMLCRLGFHAWKITPIGWGKYTIKCRRCFEQYHHLEEGDW